MRHAKQLRARRQQRRQLLRAQAAGIVDRQDLENGALALAEHLPGHDVGVMLRLGDDDLVSFADEGFAETEGHQVDRRRGAGGEDDLLAMRGIQVRPHGIARGFVLRRGQVRYAVHGTMEVGVAALGHLRPFADDGARTLRRGRVVQIDQRLAIDLLSEFGEFLPYFFNLHHREMQI